MCGQALNSEEQGAGLSHTLEKSTHTTGGTPFSSVSLALAQTLTLYVHRAHGKARWEEIYHT